MFCRAVVVVVATHANTQTLTSTVYAMRCGIIAIAWLVMKNERTKYVAKIPALVLSFVSLSTLRPNRLFNTL